MESLYSLIWKSVIAKFFLIISILFSLFKAKALIYFMESFIVYKILGWPLTWVNKRD